MRKTEKLLPPVHPGEVLREDFMTPLKLSMNRLALDLHVPVTRIAEIVHERRGITPDTALRLARYFNTSARFWLNLQATYDLEVAEDELEHTVEREVRPLPSRMPPSQASQESLVRHLPATQT
jgi:addiction module HigA family antidote